MDDLIDDAGEEVLSQAEMIKMRQEMREAAVAADRDNEPNPEELEKYIKERFGGQRCEVPARLPGQLSAQC
jgi:hypothetical protein